MTTTKKRKKPVTKRKSTPKKVKMQSFKLSIQDIPFMTMQPTIQTVYWLIIGGIIIFLTLWIVKLQLEIQSVYDSIETTTSVNSVADYTNIKAKKHSD